MTMTMATTNPATFKSAFVSMQSVALQLLDAIHCQTNTGHWQLMTEQLSPV
jgi:hypothetical protein